MRASPAPVVLAWLRRQVGTELCTTAVTVAEVRRGIARMPVGRRTDDLRRAADEVFGAFPEQVLPASTPKSRKSRKSRKSLSFRVASRARGKTAASLDRVPVTDPLVSPPSPLTRRPRADENERIALRRPGCRCSTVSRWVTQPGSADTVTVQPPSSGRVEHDGAGPPAGRPPTARRAGRRGSALPGPGSPRRRSPTGSGRRASWSAMTWMPAPGPDLPRRLSCATAAALRR